MLANIILLSSYRRYDESTYLGHVDINIVILKFIDYYSILTKHYNYFLLNGIKDQLNLKFMS